MIDLVPMLVSERLARLREGLVPAGVDAAFISSLTNVRYLTGFTGSFAALLVSADEAVLFTDGRYRAQAPAQLVAAGVEAEVVMVSADHTMAERVEQRLGSGWALGFEPADLTWDEHRAMAKTVQGSFVPVARLVEDLRLVKDEGEISRIEEASAIADAALAKVLPMLRDSLSERHFGLELDTAMRRLGAVERSFETIVASGPNSGLPHARPSDRVIEKGDLVVVDFGALVDGYHSDMTRTFAVGELTDQKREIVDLVTKAQSAGRDAVAPGVAASSIDEVCRTIISDAGYGEAFMHGTGHGVGLDIHEAPAVSRTSTSILQPGYVLTVEPGVYLPDVGGVRVEDTVVVTDDGYRALTHFPKLSQTGY